jgi:exonuclease I
MSPARISAPQQIIMQSPSEQEFMQTVEDLVTHEKCEQEVYADVRFRAAYTRYVLYNLLVYFTHSIATTPIHSLQKYTVL